jgi:hypothetical protein
MRPAAIRRPNARARLGPDAKRRGAIARRGVRMHENGTPSPNGLQIAHYEGFTSTAFECIVRAAATRFDHRSERIQSMATFKALPRGTQLVLVGCPLLLLSLFFTWQHVEVDYGPAGVATAALDGWDGWGLLLGALAATLTTVVVLRSFTDVEFSDEVGWPRLLFGFGIATFAVAIVKNITDASSSWASYGFVALAGVVAVGTYLDWRVARREPRSATTTPRRRGLSSVA